MELERMDSFSLDENCNISFSIPTPAHQSTPKKKKAKNGNKKILVCPFCQKTYELEFYYRKHLLLHDAQKDVPGHNGTANESAGSFNLTANDLSLSILSTSAAPASSAASKKFKVPIVPKKKQRGQVRKKPNFVCTYCLKEYISNKAFLSHVRIHVLQDACKRFPDKRVILENIVDVGTKALTDVSNCVACGPSGIKFRQLVGHVVDSNNQANFKNFCVAIADDLLKSVTDTMAILPSVFIGILFDRMEEILSDDSLCSEYLCKLSLQAFDFDTQSQFLLEFFMSFTLEIFRFISKTYRDIHPPRATRVHALDLEERQVIFYIGGSIMRGYLKMGRRHKNNTKWQNIVNVLKSRVLCEKPEGDVEAQWTADVDRGGLLYIRVPVQEFFKRVATVVYGSEHLDGSVKYEEVLAKVSKSSITIDWDDIIGDAVTETISLNLMNDVITYFCRAIGRGIAKRKINEIRDKPVISLATRVSVARRKKK